MSDPVSIDLTWRAKLTTQNACLIFEQILNVLKTEWGEANHQYGVEELPYLLDMQEMLDAISCHRYDAFANHLEAKCPHVERIFRISPVTEINYTLMIGEYEEERLSLSLNIWTRKALNETSWPHNAQILLNIANAVKDILPVVKCEIDPEIVTATEASNS